VKKLFGLLGKPAWEHKDTTVRLRAVHADTSPALLALLPELAQRDPDPAVRAAALQRLDDPELLARRMRGEHALEVAAAARGRLLDLLCGEQLAPERQSGALAAVDDAELLTEVATRATRSPLRRAALARINRAGLLFERCLADPDPALRLWLLERIDSPDALQRLVQAARKRDKALTRAARERLQALQLSAGDPGELERRVEALCQASERIGRLLPADAGAQLEVLRAQFAELSPHLDDGQRRRAEAWLDRAGLALGAARPDPAMAGATDHTTAALPQDDLPAANEPLAAEGVAAAAAVAPPALPDPELEQLVAALPEAGDDAFEQRLAAQQAAARACLQRHPGNPAVAAQFAAFEQAVAARRSQQQAGQAARHEAARAAQAEQLERLQTALADGNLAAARAARQALPEAGLPPELRRRLAAADADLGKLDQWQCDDAEALAGSGLHPDAVATRVKELQAEWSRLDALEPVAPPDGLTRRFRALCQRAMAPTRDFFDKRRQLREQRADAIAALIERVATAQTTDAALNAAAARDLRRELTDALRELDEVPSERRGALGRALRERLAAIDAALDAAREQALLQKRRLLATLKRELGHADDDAAAALAKSAQAEWKRLPRADRKQEDALWAELRGLIDPLFERLREREQGSRAQQSAADADARALLDELDALAAAEPERLLHAEAHLDALTTRWRGLTAAAAETDDPRAARDRRPPAGREQRPAREPRTPRREHPLEARFSAAVARVQAARQVAQRRRARQQLLALCDAGALLDRRQESTDAGERASLGSAFAALELPTEARTALQSRLAAIDGGDRGIDAGTTDIAQAEALAVRAELAAGLESPAEAAGIRRQEQMRRLAARLEGAAASDPADEIRRLMIELQALAGIDAERRQVLQQRILAAYDRVADWRG
jgi:DNA repair protein SbcC/Rad50